MNQIGFVSPVTDEELRRERHKAGVLRKSPWWKRRLAQGRCFYCGEAVAPRDLTMDHVVPLIRGGKSTKGNLVPSCKECNTKKRHMLPVEWEEYLARLREEDDW